jgi:hypothetical protein
MCCVLGFGFVSCGTARLLSVMTSVAILDGNTRSHREQFFLEYQHTFVSCMKNKVTLMRCLDLAIYLPDFTAAKISTRLIGLGDDCICAALD